MRNVKLYGDRRVAAKYIGMGRNIAAQLERVVSNQLSHRSYRTVKLYDAKIVVESFRAFVVDGIVSRIRIYGYGGRPKRLYVADTYNSRIQVFDIGENDLTFVQAFGNPTGLPAGDLDWPNGIDINGDTLYVADLWNNCIRELDLKNDLAIVKTTVVGAEGVPDVAVGYTDEDEPQLRIAAAVKRTGFLEAHIKVYDADYNLLFTITKWDYSIGGGPGTVNPIGFAGFNNVKVAIGGGKLYVHDIYGVSEWDLVTGVQGRGWLRGAELNAMDMQYHNGELYTTHQYNSPAYGALYGFVRVMPLNQGLSVPSYRFYVKDKQASTPDPYVAGDCGLLAFDESTWDKNMGGLAIDDDHGIIVAETHSETSAYWRRVTTDRIHMFTLAGEVYGCYGSSSSMAAYPSTDPAWTELAPEHGRFCKPNAMCIG